MFTQGAPITIPPMVSVFTKGIGWVAEDISTSSPVSVTADTLNNYYPLSLPASCVVKRVWWANGATVSGGATIEVGIYSDSGSFSPETRLVHGTATQGNANQVQFVDVTDKSLPAGPYWIGIVASTATDTTLFSSAVVAAQVNASRILGHGGDSSLPATATPIEVSTTTIYLCGFATTASP